MDFLCLCFGQFCRDDEFRVVVKVLRFVVVEVSAELAADEEVLLVRRDGNTFYAERRDNPLLSL